MPQNHVCDLNVSHFILELSSSFPHLLTPSHTLSRAESARPFDVLMDTFSLHEFMIRNGKAITHTPEYESYRRTYEPVWDVISVLVKQVGGGCQSSLFPVRSLLPPHSMSSLPRFTLYNSPILTPSHSARRAHGAVQCTPCYCRWEEPCGPSPRGCRDREATGSTGVE